MQTDKRTLLLIDDDPISLEVLCLVLSASNFQVTAAAGPAEALALASNPSNIFDVILTDVQMPGMTTPELVRLLKTHTSAPIVVMSGSYPEDSALVGTSGFLLKPFEVPELLAMLDKIPAPKPAAIPAGLQTLDRAKLLRAMPVAAVHQVYRAFLDDLPIRLTHLDEIFAATPTDSAALAKEAHILHGSSAMIGAEALAAACSTLETAGSNPDKGVSARGVIKRGDLITMLGEIREAAAKLEGMLRGELVGPTEKQE